jgi:small subunit ribosomal protein S12
MPLAPSLLPFRLIRQIVRRPSAIPALRPSPIRSSSQSPLASQLPSLRIQQQPKRLFSSTPQCQVTYNQVRRGCRKHHREKKRRSPVLRGRPHMKGVCLKTGITKPKKPNSGERKIARIRLSNGEIVTGYIPGEGMGKPTYGRLDLEEIHTLNGHGLADAVYVSRSQSPAAQRGHDPRWQSTGLSWCRLPYCSWCLGSGMSSSFPPSAIECLR